MDKIKAIELRREAILNEMRSIRSLRRGTISEQFFKVRRKRANDEVTQGPYFVLSRNEGGKTVSRRIPRGDALRQAQQDIDAFQKFSALSKEYAELTERMGELERQLDDAYPEQKKKRLKLPSKKKRK